MCHPRPVQGIFLTVTFLILFTSIHALAQQERIFHPKSLPIHNQKPARVLLLDYDFESDAYLLIFHEWWGINEAVKNQALAYHSALQGVNIILVDLYDGKHTSDETMAGRLAGSITVQRMLDVERAVLNFIGDEAEVVTLGWGYGASWALQAALEAGPSSRGCVLYYGMPIFERNRLKNLAAADVMMVTGSRDEFIGDTEVNRFRDVLHRLNKRLFVYEYPCEHGFGLDVTSNYSPKEAKDAFNKSLRYIGRRLIK